ncbi:hypothetical protein [Roseibium sediminis]|uniref:hypothetical protein n=1 Tax=Roseibium sediminis TaxID=1775174 RepID=UPI00123E1F37|nr:hypothetical protein [Roseibium sediminis]
MAGTVNTEVDMANEALAHLKEPAISAFDKSSTAARWFSQHYHKRRDMMLAKHEWDFALDLVRLGEDGAKPAFRWARQFRLPHDCLRVPLQTEGGRRDGAPIPLEVMGGKILTDAPAPFHLRYVRRIDRESEFSPLFVEAFSYYLAAGAAHVIAGKNSLVQTMTQEAERVLSEARATDAMQSTPQLEIMPEVIAVR